MKIKKREQASTAARLEVEIDALLQDIGRLSRVPRPAGTKIDGQMAKLVRDELDQRAGFDTHVQRFRFLRYIPKEFSLHVKGKEIDCRPCICSANTPAEGIEGNLARIDSGHDLRGRVALIAISSLHESLEIERASEGGAIGAMVFQKSAPLLAGRARYPISTIPAISVAAHTGQRLWAECARGRSNNVEVSFRVRSSQVESTGINVASLPKAEEGGARTLFVAHRDSRIFSNGAVDNGSGTALLLHLARKRATSSAILSTDAEEYGLLGAKHFVKTVVLKRTMKVVNLDSIGPGHLCLVRKSRSGFLSRRLYQRVRRLAADKLGLRLGSLTTVRGSDSDIFQTKGFEACWIRSYPTPSATTIEDTAEKIPRRGLRDAARLVLALDRAQL